jgi:Protein of unknown function (DUF2911)
MRTNRLFFVIGIALTVVLFGAVAAHATEEDQATRITFDQPVQIPGQILPAGTYMFRLVEDENLNLVQISNANQTHTYAILQTIAAERLDPTGHTVLTLAEPENGRPDALLKWFYQGDTFGHEFVYSKAQEQELAQSRQETVVASNEVSGPSHLLHLPFGI